MAWNGGLQAVSVQRQDISLYFLCSVLNCSKQTGGGMICEEIIQMKLPNLRAFLLIKQNLLREKLCNLYKDYWHLQSKEQLKSIDSKYRLSSTSSSNHFYSVREAIAKRFCP
jgi:hypothetical protein